MSDEKQSGGVVQEKRKPLVREPEEYSEVIRQSKKDEGLMAAFMVRPRGVRFETQDPEEKILLLLRRHVVTNLGWMFGSLVGVFVPFVFPFLPIYLALPATYQILTVMVWYLLVFGYAFESFLAWYFNVYIITDERIIDYDFYSLLYKRVSEAKIDKVEDVTFELGGALRSLLHYGNVYMQTAGEQRELDFEDVPNPEVVVKLLNELMLEEEREKIEGRVR